MNSAEELTRLQARHHQLLRDLAVLEAREVEKARRRAELHLLLRKAGVDPDRPEEELIRLEAETERIRAETEAQLDDFEAKLKAAGTTAEPVPKPEPQLTIENPGGYNFDTA